MEAVNGISHDVFAAYEFVSEVLVADSDDQFAAVLATWTSIAFDPAVVDSWLPWQARQGLIALEKLTRTIAAAKTVLVGRLDAGRDTTSSLVRTTGMSQRAARELHAASQIIEQHPDALHMLNSGTVSTEHLAQLSHVDTELAAQLLGDAETKSVDEYKKHVDQQRARRNTSTLNEEQHNSRSVKFFTKPNGCVGATIVLPPVEGTEFKTIITDLCDQAWKRKHPDRADVVGGHDDDPYDRRLADALVEFVRGGCTTGKPSVIIVIDAATLEAHVVPDQPISTNQALDTMARADVYAAIRDGTNKSRLVFGRNKRVATPLQKLAMLMFGETCVAEGCNVTALNCDAHHKIWYEHGGRTDLANLEFRCTGTQGHHPHEHETNGPPRTPTKRSRATTRPPG
jgi:hypothetical protein